MTPIEEQRLMREHLQRQLDPKRMQAWRNFVQTAPIGDVEEHGQDNLYPPFQSPGYAEGEMMPPTLPQQQTQQVLRDENLAVYGEPERGQEIEDAMVLKDLGYLGPPDPERYPFATDEAVSIKRLGLPIAMRSAPIAEQQAMQAYVRQQLTARHQPPVPFSQP